MIRPKHFGFNPETASNNSFQIQEVDIDQAEIQKRALHEFDNMVALLRDHAVEVVVFEDTGTPQKPDAIFPNNWITFHRNSAVITYPMQSKLRRKERREDIILAIMEKFAFERRYSLEQYEEKGRFLEGTGSMVLDRQAKIVYAAISIRTDPTILDKFCALTGYRRVLFQAKDKNDVPIYHTNVMMCIGDEFAIVCTRSIMPQDRKKVIDSLEATGKAIIEITPDQLHTFNGNALQILDQYGNAIIFMSDSARRSLTLEQKSALEEYGKILSTSLETIEKLGGGSARCMMAEIFTPTADGDY
ncbi:MAG: amidinotransferase [Saprospiraceae bacterium]|nr:amidinotransferase [Saprospiraceae bacterium]